jgi:hypothetical protein
MEHADELVPLLYDHARKLAARKYRWREGKTLPLGKVPEDIVREVYVSYVKGEACKGRRVKGVRHFDPDKDIMLQLKGAIRSALWALSQKLATKNEIVAEAEQENAEPVEFDPSDPTPADIIESADFARAAVEHMKLHPKFKEDRDLQDLLAAYELDLNEVPEQSKELGKTPEAIQYTNEVVALVVSHGWEIEWSRKAKDFGPSVKTGRVSKDSAAGERLAGIRGDSGRMVPTPAYAWLQDFNNSSDKDVKEDSVYLDYYDRTVTLLWWDDDDEE